MDYQVITDRNSLRAAVRELASKESIGLDTETTSLEPRSGRLRLIQMSDGQKVYIIDCDRFDNYGQVSEELRPLLTALRPRKVVHNIKFDYRWISRCLGFREDELKGFFDTYLAAKLCDYRLGSRLDEVTDRYLKIALDKEEQRSDWSGELSENQLLYAGKDVLHLPRLRMALFNHLKHTGQLDVARVEFEAAPIVAELEMAGFAIDPEAWEHEIIPMILADCDLKAEILKKTIGDALGLKFELPIVQASMFDDIDDKLIEQGDIVNLQSHKQMLAAFQQMGVPLQNTNAKHVQTMVAKYPQLVPLGDYRKAQKLVSNYGVKILKALDPVTGRLHATFWQVGTEPGRFSCSDPNIQQIPKEPINYREVCRPLDPDRCIVLADYSQLELRILAHLSQDEVMLDAYRNEIDLHCVTAAGFTGLPVEQMKGHPARDFAKILNFGIAYGMGPDGLADRIKKKKREAEKMLKEFKGTYPGMHRWFDLAEAEGLRNGYVRTLSGRLVKLDIDKNPESRNGPARRGARNFQIQGSTGDMLKTAMPVLHRKLQNYRDAYLVNIVHDEALVECNREDAEAIKYDLEEALKYGFHKFIPPESVPCVSDAKICGSWADKDKKVKKIEEALLEEMVA